jgi:phosphatidylserine decarboxylase
MRVAKESLPIAIVLCLAAVAGAFFLHYLAAVPFLLLALFSLWFFRDPERSTPADPLALVSPADGRVIRADGDTVSIFMNVFDVHVCRSPMEGRIERIDHRSGRFMAAFRDGASEQNERAALLVAGEERRLRFTLVAGLIARRIVLWVSPGERLEKGQRVGLIQFGSRVDVSLPPGGRLVVGIGRKVRAGETVIARVDREPEGDI